MKNHNMQTKEAVNQVLDDLYAYIKEMHDTDDRYNRSLNNFSEKGYEKQRAFGSAESLYKVMKYIEFKAQEYKMWGDES